MRGCVVLHKYHVFLECSTLLFYPWHQILLKELGISCQVNFDTIHDFKISHQFVAYDAGPDHHAVSTLLSFEPSWCCSTMCNPLGPSGVARISSEEDKVEILLQVPDRPCPEIPQASKICLLVWRGFFTSRKPWIVLPCEFGFEFLSFPCLDLVDIVGHLDCPVLTAQHLCISSVEWPNCTTTPPIYHSFYPLLTLLNKNLQVKNEIVSYTINGTAFILEISPQVMQCITK